jgi:hypothetical protein
MNARHIDYSSVEMYGPVEVGGNYYRVVSYTIRNGGHGMGSEVWKAGRWLLAWGGPGCNVLLATRLATEIELSRAGVDCSLLPSNYDPITVEGEEPHDG